MDSRREYDAVIVGAGPAGSAAAILLARQGFDVLLLDRAKFPRDKPCGEFITPGCAPILKNLGVWTELLLRGLHRIDTALIFGTRNNTHYVPPEDEPAGWSMRRTDFDHILVKQANLCGAEVRECAKVRGLLRNGSRIIGVQAETNGKTEAIRARLVIGADGTHSIVARCMGVVRPIGRLHRVALVSHWRGVSGSTIEMRAQRDAVCGVGPLCEDCANVTLVVPTSESPCLAGRVEDYFEERIRASFPEVSDRLARGRLESVQSVGCFGHFTSSPVAHGAMLIGDAASFIDPFTGEGIYFALRGAELAVETASEALKAGNTCTSRLEAYTRRREELNHRYRLCDVVQSIVRTPGALNRFISGMERNPESRARLMSILSDLRPAKQALNPRLLADLAFPF